MKLNIKYWNRQGGLRFLLLVTIVLLLFAGSCTRRKNISGEKNMIPEKDLVPLLTDIYLANGLLSIPSINFQYSSLDSNSTYNLVIEKHGYTKEMMDQTLKYYFTRNPKKLNKIYDQVLGILSNVDTRIEREALIEQSRLINKWPGKDYYANPSDEGNDSTRFELELTAGFYILSFTATFHPDDQSLMPQAAIYSYSHDSIGSGNFRILRSPAFLKDGQPHYYVMTINVPEENFPRLLMGWFNSAQYLQSGLKHHFLIEDISLSYSRKPL